MKPEYEIILDELANNDSLIRYINGSDLLQYLRKKMYLMWTM